MRLLKKEGLILFFYRAPSPAVMAFIPGKAGRAPPPSLISGISLDKAVNLG
jgi:hypothetical protein